MPKVLLTAQARAEDHAEAANQAIRVAVATRMMRDGITQRQVAERIGITPVTLSRRLARPGMFTLNEIRRLAETLNFTETEKRIL